MNSVEMNSVAKELQSITVGDPTHFGGLTIFPLFRNGSAPAEPGYTLLEEAIGRGTANITELGAGGSVPELRFENLGEQPVLLLDGEELVGAKQNRALNLTILAPAKRVIVIPVSCVEAGRWHAESDTFQPTEHVMYSRARAAKGAQVSLSMATSDSRRSDQSAIWDGIASKSERLGVRLRIDFRENEPVRRAKIRYSHCAVTRSGLQAVSHVTAHHPQHKASPPRATLLDSDFSLGLTHSRVDVASKCCASDTPRPTPLALSAAPAAEIDESHAPV